MAVTMFGEVAAGLLAHAAHAIERDARLLADVALADEVALAVDGALPGDEEQVAGADALRERQGRGPEGRGLEELEVGHGTSPSLRTTAERVAQ